MDASRHIMLDIDLTNPLLKPEMKPRARIAIIA